ncbi:TetR/AcrR family transcriptional regulator [Nocardia blacklockiae]|uniref:TetR/AcrR family transcriptional regulator n=1 Tax=Nocardia blacklockiae TaxID=480036 RepID=UPI0018930169|nr:TetR/AcrR family transcriptional regulator [Nocardia blacklockiae]MBF6170802.1 TetR/AcrR family transcriptional regulator [Nocardia blacklockiae]
MGNREDLLAGARRCLVEKGYARTTVRDISTAAGVSMAAIGYHFGTKEALLTAALAEATREWGVDLEHALARLGDAGGDPWERFAARWDVVLATIATHRGMWTATFDALADPDVRTQLAANLDEARSGLARLLAGADEGDADATRGVGALYQALLTGVAAQYLIDPDRAPTGRDLAAGLRRITAPGG